MGLREIIGAATGGGQAGWDAVTRWLKTNYIDSPSEKERIDAAQKRDCYYAGGGDHDINRMIEVAFSDPLTKKLRADLIRWAKWNNVIRRVAGELATVYSEPATRSIGGDPDAYRAFVEHVNADATMREVDEKLTYHEDVWIQYRVRLGEPVLDVVSPGKFWAVHAPDDRTHLIAIILDQKCSDDAREARYRVMAADETFQMDGRGVAMSETHEPWSYGLPGVLVSTRPATVKGSLLSDTPAADLVAAHEAIWFLGVLLIKESKSANNQTYVSGDTSAAALGQSSDTERENLLPEGVTVQSVDRGMNLDQFTRIADHVLERAAANHGLPPAVLHQSGATSGAEIHLRRIPLRELRKKRIPILRRAERQLAILQAKINAVELKEYAFDPAGWSIDFGEIQQPLTESEQLAVFETERRLGLTSTLAEIRRRNPDIENDIAAAEFMQMNINRETARIVMMKNLIAMSGSMGAEQPSEEDPAPFQNANATDEPR